MSTLLGERLLKRANLGNLRSLKTVHNLIDFSSNDYLGLARSSDLATSIFQEWNRVKGLGSTGSRLLTGNSAYVEELENRIATFHGHEAGLLFNCGYMANVGLLSAIAGDKDMIFFDARVHASTHDGIRLSRARAFPFKHNDLEHLESRLKNSLTRGNCYICIESIYSTDGSKAPLPEICHLAKEYGAHVIVDEAHAVGVCGPGGRGLVAEHHLTSQVFAQVTTFGKALGVQGAIVLGTPTLKHSLINFATSYIYTTALSFPLLTAIKCSYDRFPTQEQERRSLRRSIQICQHALPHASGTHIQSVSAQGNGAVRHLAEKCAQAGFDVRPLMSPTVRQGDEKVRICLHAFNTEEELKHLLEILNV